MEIVHLAPFAPHAAGIYEAARDMVRADTERGHLVSFVDVGATLIDGQQQPAQVGAVDDRGGFRLVTLPVQWCDTADLLVYHTGVNDGWVVKSQAPIIVIVHGRPAACFRPEQSNPARNSFSLAADFAQWPRIKKMVHFWPEFEPYWRILIPDNKRVALDWPPIDLARFTPTGPHHQFAPAVRGKINALICDSWREDVDCFEIACGAIEAARHIPGLRVHFYGLETVTGTGNLPHCWDYLINELRRLGALGELNGRQPDMDQVYRAVDFVLTPHRIVTRIIGEALATGTPVLAANGCKVTPYTADIFNPEEVAEAAARLVQDLKGSQAQVQAACLETARLFSLERYGAAIEKVYQEAVA